MSVACDLITLRVTGHAEPRGCEQAEALSQAEALITLV